MLNDVKEALHKALMINDFDAVREILISEIRAERKRQISKCKHGGDTEKFDSANRKNDWVAYIMAYAGRASTRCARNYKDGEDFRKNMIKVAALALAALEANAKGYC